MDSEAISQQPVLYGNLETSVLIWLGRSVNATDSNTLTSIKKLRQCINNLKLFDSVHQCEQYIRRADQRRILLVVSGDLSQNLIPYVHNLRNIAAIFVFCEDRQAHVSLAEQYRKVQIVTEYIDEVITAIQTYRRRHERAEEPLSIIANDNDEGGHGESTTDLNTKFIFYQLFIDVLSDMQLLSTNKHEFVALCKTYYHGNSTMTRVVEEFDQEYSSDRAVWWYTRESFIYSILNKALRKQDYGLILKFRFFIRDLFLQLSASTPISTHVYRGQVLSASELARIRASVGKYISMNSFLSTSRDRSLALFFAESSAIDDTSQVALFEIDLSVPGIDALHKQKAFADVSKISYFGDEGEVLFMIGTVFMLTEIEYQNNVWIIKLSLDAGDNYMLHPYYANLRYQLTGYNHLVNKFELFRRQPDFRSVSRVLCELGEYERAKYYYMKIMESLAEENIRNMIQRISCLDGLAYIAFKEKNFELSCDIYVSALEIIEGHEVLEFFSAHFYTNIGRVHRIMGNYKLSLAVLERVLVIISELDLISERLTGFTCNDIGAVLTADGKYEQAFKYFERSLPILNKCSYDRERLADLYGNIATLYSALEQYETALKFYRKCLEIQQKALPYDHPTVSMTHRHIALTYERIANSAEAIEHLNKAVAMSKGMYALIYGSVELIDLSAIQLLVMMN